MKNRYARISALIFAGCVLLVLVAVGILRMYSNSRLQNAITEYKKDAGSLNGKDYAPAAVVETNNIAVWLNAAAGAFVITNDERNILLSDLQSHPFNEWNADSKSKFREILLRNAPGLQLINRMAELNQSSFGLTYTQGDMESPNFYTFLQARKLLACKWRMDLGEGNIHEVVRDAAALERMAAALEQEPILLSTLVGHVSEKEWHELMHTALPSADERTLISFEQQVEHLQSMAMPVKDVLAAEGAMNYWSLRETNSLFRDENSEVSNALARWGRVDRRLVIATSMEVYADLIRKSNSPVVNLHPLAESPFKFGPSKIWHELLDNLQEGIERHQATASARLLAQLALKIRREGLRQGTYPKNVEPKSSPYTGESVRYELHPDGSATVSFPKADQFWESRHKDGPPQKPRFVWNLPPIRQTR